MALTERDLPPGTRPPGARDEREAGAQVREMFSRIAPRYDFLNHFLSLSFDRLWRRRTARRCAHIFRRPDARVLDLCCGTGDLIFALEHAAKTQAEGRARGAPSFFGADFALPMLERARGKGRRGGWNASFLAADALALPFADACFDLVTLAFGFRNLANYRLGLGEIARVLRPGGELGVLEFSEPRKGALSALYRFYFGRVLPKLGRAVSGDEGAYSYLPESVGRFPEPEVVADWIKRAGYRNVQFQLWTGGIVTLHRAVRP